MSQKYKTTYMDQEESKVDRPRKIFTDTDMFDGWCVWYIYQNNKKKPFNFPLHSQLNIKTIMVTYIISLFRAEEKNLITCRLSVHKLCILFIRSTLHEL